MQHIRHGGGAVRPYIYALLDTIELIRNAFEATELERLVAENGFHIEARIGDSMIVLEAADPPISGGTISSIYVYVPDVDKAFEKALESGATSISEPEDKPYNASFSSIIDVIGGRSPTPGVPVRQALQQDYSRQLIIEIPGRVISVLILQP